MDKQSGWGRYAFELINGVRKSGNDVEFFLSYGGLYEFLRALIFERRKIKKCDIIHALDVYPYGVMAYLTNIFFGKQLVISAQGTYAIEPLYNAKTALLARRSLNSAQAVIAISNFTKNELIKKIKPRKIEVINHGIDLDVFYQEHLKSAEEFILSVGALKHRKGYHISIPAFALVRQRFPALKYKIVGDQRDTVYFKQLKVIAQQYNVIGEVEFLSGISDEELRQLYQKARIFLLTSLNSGHSFEGLGLVFLEAAAAGLPVVGTLGNGIEDAVKNGYNGILVQQGDVRSAAEAILSILEDSERWNQASKNSHRWAKDHSLEKMVREYIALYEKVLHASKTTL